MGAAQPPCMPSYRRPVSATPRLLAMWVCLAFTGLPEAGADDSRWPTSGAIAEAGSAVGISEVGEATVSTLGGHLGVGYQLGAISLQAQAEDLAMLQYVDDASGNRHRGELRRFGLGGRLVVADLRRGFSAHSRLLLYVDAGVGVQSGRWSSGDRFERRDASGGGGWILDHRMDRQAGGLPFRSVGWQFGWRVSAARATSGQADGSARIQCEVSCAPPMPDQRTDLGLLVTSSLTATW